jgi:tetratricopeptide (TPR) repeat protein
MLLADANGCVKRGRAALRRKDFAEALADFQTTLRLDPQNAAALHGLGKAYFKRGEDWFNQHDDKQRALADWETAIAYGYRTAEIYQDRGITQFLLKNYELAIADLSEAIRLDPAAARSAWPPPPATAYANPVASTAYTGP